MAITVNLDVDAGAAQDALQGTRRADRHHRAERLAAEIRQGQGHPVRYAEPDLYGARLPARRYSGIRAGLTARLREDRRKAACTTSRARYPQLRENALEGRTRSVR